MHYGWEGLGFDSQPRFLHVPLFLWIFIHSPRTCTSDKLEMPDAPRCDCECQYVCVRMSCDENELKLHKPTQISQNSRQKSTQMLIMSTKSLLLLASLECVQTKGRMNESAEWISRMIHLSQKAFSSSVIKYLSNLSCSWERDLKFWHVQVYSDLDGLDIFIVEELMKIQEMCHHDVGTHWRVG